MPAILDLAPDELLTTTRSVRRRLDLSRPVAPALVDECVRIAQQAPTSSNRQYVHFVVVTEPEARAALGELYRRGFDAYAAAGFGGMQAAGAGEQAHANARVRSSAVYLAERMGEVPVLVVPCVERRTDGASTMAQASVFGSVGPQTWSFMLAARARGLGTCWTTLHLAHEREAAELLGIPYDAVMQTALVPVAHTIGTEFKPAWRAPLERMLHRERW